MTPTVDTRTPRPPPLPPPYALDGETQVWSRPDYRPIAYSEGETVERRIGEIVGQTDDLSVLSPQLEQHGTDWPSRYHLGNSRANLLRPFQDTFKGREVLEVGAGCGALTRFLGESGARVLALEGSLRRAAIARARCRDLPDVTVVAEQFECFRAPRPFDVVTLIGVLEYAPAFTSGATPVLSMLRQVRALLKPDGALILAIENQLGLKYFAGAPEDHLGAPMYGIEGRYRPGEARTFGRAELAALLREAGFADHAFLAPFPDYKLPVCIVSEPGFTTPAFDVSALLRQTVTRDPQLPRPLAFAPERVWPALAANGLALDLANSFLVRATPQAPPPGPPPPLAWHYATRRAPPFCKQTVFAVDPARGRVTVTATALGAATVSSLPEHGIRWQLPGAADYLEGRPFADAFAEVLARDGWRAEQLAPLFRQYRDLLVQQAAALGRPCVLRGPDDPLPGALWDLIPQNILADRDGALHPFDQEWRLDDDVAWGWMVVRALLYVMQSLTRIGRCADREVATPADLLMAAGEAADAAVSREWIETCIEREIGLQHAIAGWPGPPRSRPADILDGPLPLWNDALLIADQRQRLAELVRDREQAQARITALTRAQEQTRGERDTLAASLDALRQASRNRWSGRLGAVLRPAAQPVLRVAGLAGTCLRAVREFGPLGASRLVLGALRRHGAQAVWHQFRAPAGARRAPGGLPAARSRPGTSAAGAPAPGEARPYPARLNPYDAGTNAERCRHVLEPEARCTRPHAPGEGLSVIVLNLDHPEYIIPLGNRLLGARDTWKTAGLDLEILVGDTGSRDRRVLDYYQAQQDRLKVVPGLRYHFSANNNQLAGLARNDTLLFLNNDIILPPRGTAEDQADALLRLYRELHRDPRTGIVGACLFFEDLRLQHAGVDFIREPRLRGFCHHPRCGERIAAEAWPRAIEVPAVTGACLMVRSPVFAACGGFSTAYAAECQDVDLCLRARRLGQNVVLVNAGTIIHLENGTRPKQDENWKDRQLFMRRWSAFIEAAYL